MLLVFHSYETLGVCSFDLPCGRCDPLEIRIASRKKIPKTTGVGSTKGKRILQNSKVCAIGFGSMISEAILAVEKLDLDTLPTLFSPISKP